MEQIYEGIIIGAAGGAGAALVLGFANRARHGLLRGSGMRRMSLLIVLAGMLAAHPVVAQDAKRQARSVQAAQPTLEIQVEAPADEITLRNFDRGQEGEIWFADQVAPADSGFVFGTNWFEDQAKATAFALPDGITEAQVKEVHVWFAFKRDGLTTQSYSLDFLEGTPASGPTGAPLFSQSFLLAGINADADLETGEATTIHVLSQPVSVGSSFFVSVDFGSYGQADWTNTGIISTVLQEQRIAEVWEKWSDGSWHNVSDAWWGSDAEPGTGTNGWQLWIEVFAETSMMGTAVEDVGEIPRALALSSNYPNPFRSATTLRFELPTQTEVDLQVVDLLGRTVARLVEGSMEAGVHTVRFEAGSLPSGLYLARLHTGAGTHTRKLVLLK